MHQNTSELTPTAVDEALIGAAEAMGELMAYWGFKRIHGALWTLLFLEPDALSQQDLMTRSGYSKGAVSMALGELSDWGVVRVERPLRGRGLRYRAETDLGAMVRTVLSRRERPMLGTARQRFGEALAAMEADTDCRHRRYAAARLQQLVGLTDAALWTLDRFVEAGTLPFSRLRDYFERGLGGAKRAASNAPGEPGGQP